MVPDIVLAGHIVKDVGPGGWQPGGGVTFGAVQAARLGLSVGVLTSCSSDVHPARLFPDIAWHIVAADQTTTFDNQYHGGRRSQRVLSRATRLHYEDVPSEWRRAPIALLTPVIDDLDADMPARFAASPSLVGTGAQGWLRRLAGERVVIDPLTAVPGWLAGDVVFVSDEDVLDPETPATWRQRVPVVVLTRGRGGCTVWDRAGRHDLPAFDRGEVDPTGAGDVFATAFLVRYRECANAVESARFASAAAALAVARPRLEGIAGRAQIESLLATSRMAVER